MFMFLLTTVYTLLTVGMQRFPRHHIFSYASDCGCVTYTQCFIFHSFLRFFAISSAEVPISAIFQLNPAIHLDWSKTCLSVGVEYHRMSDPVTRLMLNDIRLVQGFCCTAMSRGRKSRLMHRLRYIQKKAWTAPEIVILTEAPIFNVSLPSDPDVLWPQWAFEWAGELHELWRNRGTDRDHLSRLGRTPMRRSKAGKKRSTRLSTWSTRFLGLKWRKQM